MKSKLASLFAVTALLIGAQGWEIAKPGYHFEFPRDNFEHPNYQTEWWYYTGNLRTPEGHRFGFELTFFRSSMKLPAEALEEVSATWRPDTIYLAHFALSDLDGGKFYYEERLHRAGPGLAGASLSAGRYWNGNWNVQWTSLPANEQRLEAVSERFRLQLRLTPGKPIVIHGQNGVTLRGADESDASHYLSFTRMAAEGSLHSPDGTVRLNGLAWMDHEFFTQEKESSVTGWNWFAVQLDNNEELMIYAIRKNAGAAQQSYITGTFVDAKGIGHFLKPGEIALHSAKEWKSPHSGTRYPLQWTIDIPSLQIHLVEETALLDQELFQRDSVTPNYWEGAVTYTGTAHSGTVNGVGYLEMTGYEKPVWLHP